MVYGLVLLSLIAVAILGFTILIPESNGNDKIPKKQPEITARMILKSSPLIDGFNGLPQKIITANEGSVNKFPFEYDLRKIENSTNKYNWCQTDLPRMYEGSISTQIWAVEVPCSTQYKDATTKTLQQIDVISRLVNKYSEKMNMIYTADGINKTFEEKKIGNMIGISGGHSIDNKISVLRAYYNLGVRYLRLTSECSTPWAQYYFNRNVRNEYVLTDFGKKIIQEMNRIGIIIDLAHSSYETQIAVLKETKAPIIYSSAAAFSLVKNERNIREDTLQKVKENDGLVMISFDPKYYFISTENESVSINHVIDHINHIVKTIGINHVGIGSGYNRMEKRIEHLEDSSKYPDLFDMLLETGKWSEEDVKKLAGLNFYRVLKSVEEVSDKLTVEMKPDESFIPVTDIAESNRGCYTAT